MNFLTTPGKRLFLTGDEAVARAALEMGVRVVTGYPGNPSTKTISALLPLAGQYGMTVEWSVNEKVALEVATGAAWAGRRGLVTMKMSGINAMADSLLSIAHSGVNGALVIYAVDDVGTYYGMVEQDSRHYALLASLPLLMPACPEDAYSMTRLAFTVSAQTGAPVIVLSTTAVANAITTMKVGTIERVADERSATFTRNLPKFTKAVPQWCLDQHADTLNRLEHAGRLLEQTDGPNFVSYPEKRPTTGRRGVIVSGVSYTCVQEVLQAQPDAYAQLAVCKIGGVYPFPRQTVLDFLAHVDSVLVLEELEPIIETQVLALTGEERLPVRVTGKRDGLLPRVGDYSLELVQHALKTFCGILEIPETPVPNSHEMVRTQQTEQVSVAALPRTLEFCPGCPHRMTYYALNQAIEELGFAKDEVITTGDIGCTIIGMNAPLDACWTEVSMGASIGIAQGFKYAGIEKPVLAAMGDGTFYHNGVAGLLNAVQAGVNVTLIILDNSRSAMTGMQPDAGTGRRASGDPAAHANIAMIARGCGVEHIQRVNPYHLREMVAALRDAMNYSGVSVVIAEAPCTMPGVLIADQPVRIDQDVCMAGRGCEDTPCYSRVGCPSVLFSLDDVRPRLSIDSATCVSCGLCAEACPFDAIRPINLETGQVQV